MALYQAMSLVRWKPMRTLALVALIAITACAFGQDAARRVTFQMEAAPVKRVLETLSKQVGLELITSPQTANDTLLISVKEVPLSDLMQKIAQVCSAEWVQARGAYRLVRPPAIQHRELEAQHARLTGLYEKALAPIRESVAKLEPFSQQEAEGLAQAVDALERSWRGNAGPDEYRAFSQRVEPLVTRSPVRRFFTRFTETFSPSELAAFSMGDRVVFSSHPTAMQRPLPPRTLPILANFLAEQQLWAEARKKMGEAEQRAPMTSGLSVRTGLESDDKIFVAIEPEQWSKSLSIHLSVYSAQGRLKLTDMQHLNADQYAAPEFEARQAELAQNEKPLELSPITKELAKLVERMGSGGGRVEVSKELQERLANPERHDPLSFGATEVLHGVAEASGLNVVGNLHDLMLLLGLEEGRTYTPSGAKAMLPALEAHIVEEDGWLLIMPIAPVETRQGRIDRISLGQLVRGAVQKNRLGLEERMILARFVDKNVPPLMLFYAMIVIQEPFTDLDEAELKALRLLGSFTAPQLRSLEQGGMPLRSLTPEQRAIVHRHVMGGLRSARPMLDEPGGPAEVYGNIVEEATWSLPDGPDSEGRINLTVNRLQRVLASSSTGDARTAGPRLLSAEELASFLVMYENPASMPQGQTNLLDRFILIDRTEYVLEIRPGSRLLFQLKASDDIFDRHQQPVAFDRLPEAFRAEVEKHMKTAREWRQKMQPPRRDAPPPRPDGEQWHEYPPPNATMGASENLRCLILNCTLKKSPEPSNTQVLIDKTVRELTTLGVESETVRLVDYRIAHGTSSDEGDGDQWPLILDKIRACDIFILASPVWVGHLCSVAQQVIERLDAIFHEEELQDPETGQYLTYNKVAGAIVTGNEDGAHSCAAQMLWALQELGFTIPPNVNTYWVGPAGPGPSYVEAGGERHLFTNKTMLFMAHNLVYMARLLKEHPIPTNLSQLAAQAQAESDDE
jgi:multimeric flavodoxin WrbA